MIWKSLVRRLTRWWFRGWPAALLLGCAGTQDVVCSDVSLRAVEVAHTEAALAVIESGKCDAHEAVGDCPAYRDVEAYFEPGYTGWRLCR